ncbi:MAG: phosphopantetheine-binding protein [Desulfobulbaceae bacterium]|jgi:acyl carrier protein|nr:phosphopantetheine-binding protein [Desulfobulbaceae bacterium]
MLSRDEISRIIIKILVDDFEFKDPKLDDNLRDAHGFDSIDAIELLAKIEKMLGFSLTRAEKEAAMDIRTINDILNYLDTIQRRREI